MEVLVFSSLLIPQLNVKRTFFILFSCIYICTFNLLSHFLGKNIFMDFKSRYFLFRCSARCRVGEHRDLVGASRLAGVRTFSKHLRVTVVYKVSSLSFSFSPQNFV